MWKGTLAAKGLKLPVKLYAAVEDRGVHFHLLHGRGEERVEQKMVDPESGEAVPPEDVRKGYEAEPGVFVVLDHEDLASLEPEPTRDVELVRFVPAGTIDQAYYERPYWLGPDGDDEGYFALVDALKEQEREGVARWVMRKRPYVGALRAEGDHLSLIALRHAGEVVLASELAAPGGRDLDAREKKLAEQLVEALADSFDPDAWHDTYRERVEELIAAKAKGRKVKLGRPRARKETDSLEKALQASLARTKPKAAAEGAAEKATKRAPSRAAGGRKAAPKRASATRRKGSTAGSKRSPAKAKGRR
jgi:DNA end-binding protein Ku